MLKIKRGTQVFFTDHLSRAEYGINTQLSQTARFVLIQTPIEEDDVCCEQRVRTADGRQMLVDTNVTYEVDNYIEYYSCKPPVIFIPLITLLQVRVQSSRSCRCEYTVITLLQVRVHSHHAPAGASSLSS